MIGKNDVTEADLSNPDNQLYSKLLDRSKTVLPGDNLTSPTSLYRHETTISELMKKKPVKASEKRSLFSKNQSIT